MFVGLYDITTIWLKTKHITNKPFPKCFFFLTDGARFDSEPGIDLFPKKGLVSNFRRKLLLILGSFEVEGRVCQ